MPGSFGVATSAVSVLSLGMSVCACVQNVYSSYVITFVQESGALSSTYSDALLSVFWATTVLSRLLVRDFFFLLV